MIRLGVTPDLLTDQTSAHDALNGYVPHNMSLEEAFDLLTLFIFLESSCDG